MRVRGWLGVAFLVAGCSRDHQLDLGTVPPQPAPVIVESVAAGSVTLRWAVSDSAGIVEYRMYRQGPSDDDFQLAGTSTIQRGSVTGLLTGTVYALRVAGVSGRGVEGPRSETVVARPSLFAVAINGSADVTSNPFLNLQLSSAGYNQVRVAEGLAPLSQTNYQLVPSGLVLSFLVTGADGPKTVHVQYRDGVTGAESEVVSDVILLDRQAAISQVTHNAGTTPRSAGFVIHFAVVTGEPDGIAAVDIGAARTGIRLYDDGTNGDLVAGNGTYEADYSVEATFDANDVPVTGRFTDRAGNGATPVQGSPLVTISNPPPPVQLLDAVNQGGGRVLLQWEQSSVIDFQSYRIWHAPTSPVLASAQRILDSTITVRTASTLVVDGLGTGATRYFLVEVLDAAGNAASNALSEKSVAVSEPAMVESRVAPARRVGRDARRPENRGSGP